MKLLALLLLVACETSPPEATPGVSNTAPPPTVPAVVVDAAIATVPGDAAAKVAVVEAAPTPTPTPLVEQESATALAIISDDKDPGDMHDRRPGADLARQVEEARGAADKPVVTGGGGTAGPTPVDTNGPSGRISISQKRAVDRTSLDVNAVLAKIQAAYFSGLKRCYRSYLQQDPTVRGRLSLTFTVDSSGRTSAAKATGMVAQISDCVTRMMTAWRFPIPKDASDQPTTARFEIELALVPD